MDDANDLVEAARHFERALELAPHDLEIIRHVVVLLQGLGRLDEAIALGQYAIGRDPVNAPNYANLGNSYRWSRRPEEAISAYRAALRLSPDLGAAQSFIGIALLAQGRHPEALESMEREPFEPYRLIGLTMVYHSLGEAAKSGAVLAQLIEKYGHEWAYNIAYVHAWRGDTEGVFQWLDNAVAFADPGLSLIVAEPQFAPVHDDPRWAAFMERLGKSPRQLAAVVFETGLKDQAATGRLSGTD